MSNLYLQQLQQRVLLLDGAMGTSIHGLDLDLEKDYLGKENCTEVLVLTRPDDIQGIHESFLEVGSDGVETDTFGGMLHVLSEFDLQDRCREINRTACEIARAACEKYSTDDKPRFVIGSMGPGTKLITLSQIDWETMFNSYREQAMGLLEGGTDVFLIETQQDLLALRCIIAAITDAMDEFGTKPAVYPEDDGTPIMVQVTIEQMGTMLAGSEISAAGHALEKYPIASLGMNCATGPTDMAEHIKWLTDYWPRYISVLPNAGLPSLVEGRTEYPLQPKDFGTTMAEFVDRFGLNVVGGCCGTTPEHLGELHKALLAREGGDAAPKREPKPLVPSSTSLYSPVPHRQENSTLNIGERCNASGSRAFKRLLEEEDWDAMVSLARDQIREGSHVLDVNVDYAGRDNAADMAEIVKQFARQVDAPLMLDSTQSATIRAGLQHAPGKCLINSANLEEGEEKFAEFCKLARDFNAALVLGTIDEDPEESMARTADRKVEITERMVKLATETHGLDESDLFIDTLVLPISTGMDKDRRSALETIEGTRRITEQFPNVQTTCGLSNVSFGLKPAARQVLNSAFLNELVEAGMSSAIVHISKILPQNRIDDAQWEAAMDLLYNRWRDEGDEVELADGTKTRDPLQIFIDMFPDEQGEVSTKQDLADLPLEERLQKHIIDGEKKQLEATLEEAMEKYSPLDIINDHLLAGMKVVGELFGSGKMQLPFVLQSAEVMKTAVAHLEPHMERKEGDTKGTIVLATVKGDVHDIGKNLVDIILTNNGYTVHNIGIKQPVDAIIGAYEEHKADAIGMSGLLVKSVNVMEENLREMSGKGMDVPILLGGAALARHYCDSYLREIYKETGGRVYHGRDAFEGLRVMDKIMADEMDELDTEIEERLEKRQASEEKVAKMREKEKADKAEAGEGTEGEGGAAVAVATKSDVATDVEVPEPPFFGDRMVKDIPLDDIYPFINPIALFRGQWQFRKGSLSDKEYDALLEDTVHPLFEELKAKCRDENILQPALIYGYYPCNSDGEDLILYDPEDHDRELERFSFPRQEGKKRMCISDFFRSVDSGEKDVLGMSCVTMGRKVSEIAHELFESDKYQDYLYMHGMGVETAEALAEMWHKRMRQEMGIGGDDASTMRDMFAQKYRGSRYSFGYPACPEMSDQEKLFRLLKPERIGCELTDNWQIDPEQSTSAIIVHHPEAKYFNV